MKKLLLSIAFLSLIGSMPLPADQMAPEPYLVASGKLYAKSFPAEEAKVRGGNEAAGKTLIYRMGNAEGDADKLIHHFNWYARKIYLTWCDGACVVRMGPPGYRQKPSEKDLAIAFYRDGVLLARYSPLDLIDKNSTWRQLQQSRKVQATSIGYTIIEQIVGFVFIYKEVDNSTLFAAPDRGFEIVLHDGTHIVFDLRTGKPLVLAQDEFTQPDPRR